MDASAQFAHAHGFMAAQVHKRTYSAEKHTPVAISSAPHFPGQELLAAGTHIRSHGGVWGGHAKQLRYRVLCCPLGRVDAGARAIAIEKPLISDTRVTLQYLLGQIHHRSQSRWNAKNGDSRSPFGRGTI